MDARRGAWKHNLHSIVIRWQEDEKHRNSKQAHGWTEEYCRYLDFLTTFDISYTVPWHQRHQHESAITLVCNDDDRQAGLTRARRDFKPTTKILTGLRQEQGLQNCEQNWNGWVNIGKLAGRNLLPPHHQHNKGGNTNTETLSMARTPRHSMARSPMARSQVVERVMATDSLQILCGSHFARFLHIRRIFHRFRVQTLANVVHATVKTEHIVARTFFSVLSVSRTFEHLWPPHAHARGSWWRYDCGVLHICAPSLKVMHSHSIFNDHSSTCLTHLQHFVHTTWNQETLSLPPPPAPLRQEGCCLQNLLRNLLSNFLHHRLKPLSKPSPIPLNPSTPPFKTPPHTKPIFRAPAEPFHNHFKILSDLRLEPSSKTFLSNPPLKSLPKIFLKPFEALLKPYLQSLVNPPEISSQPHSGFWGCVWRRLWKGVEGVLKRWWLFWSVVQRRQRVLEELWRVNWRVNWRSLARSLGRSSGFWNMFEKVLQVFYWGFTRVWRDIQATNNERTNDSASCQSSDLWREQENIFFRKRRRENSGLKAEKSNHCVNDWTWIPKRWDSNNETLINISTFWFLSTSPSIHPSSPHSRDVDFCGLFGRPWLTQN